MEHINKSQLQSKRQFSQEKLKYLYSKGKGQSFNTKLEKSYTQVSVENFIRRKNQNLIEKERKKTVPQLNLKLSPLIIRRKLQKSMFFDKSQQSQFGIFISQVKQTKISSQKSKYVLEIDNKEFQREKQKKQNQEGEMKMPFKAYNRYKMLTSELFFGFALIIMIIIYKAYDTMSEKEN